jgi:hypothetical protein
VGAGGGGSDATTCVLAGMRCGLACLPLVAPGAALWWHRKACCVQLCCTTWASWVMWMRAIMLHDVPWLVWLWCLRPALGTSRRLSSCMALVRLVLGMRWWHVLLTCNWCDCFCASAVHRFTLLCHTPLLC